MITVYVLRSEINGKRYVGMTADLAQRLVEHQKQGTTVARQLGRFKLIHTEEYPDYSLARTREKFLKSGQGRDGLIESLTRPLSWIGIYDDPRCKQRSPPDHFPPNA